MVFSLINYQPSTPEQQSPFGNLLSNALQKYNAMTQSQYLQPTLAEELKKSQLYNKWYEPNIKSEIGLRGAQAGHLGAETTALNISNPFLKQKLIDEQAARTLKAAQDKIFIDMLKQRQQAGNTNPNEISNIPGNINQPSQQYQPGQGQPMFAGINQEEPQIQPTSNNIPTENHPNFYQQPQITNDDIINKKFFGIDTFTPRQKAYSDYINKIMSTNQTEKIKNEAKEAYDDYKQTSAAQTDLPVLQNSLKAAMRMRDIILNRPAFWGHNWFPERFAKTANDPLVGEFQSELIPQLANMEKSLSEKGNQLALKVSASKLPGFESTQEVNLGKINGLIASLQNQIAKTRDIAGGYIKRIGTKRFKKINGKWHQLERGDF